MQHQEAQPKTQSQTNQQRQKAHRARRNRQSEQPSLKGTRITPTHILFWSGPLSNWHIAADAKTFSGRRALEILTPRLDEARIDHPGSLALSTRLLVRHNFNCGEQFMMACKGWLFELEKDLEAESETLSEDEAEHLCEPVLIQRENSLRPHNEGHTQPQPPLSDGNACSLDLARLKRAHDTLIAVLSTDIPRDQKALGRQARNFSETVWTAASAHVVVAACVARAEVDEQLRQLYIFAGDTIPSAESMAARARTDTTSNTTRRNYALRPRGGEKQGAPQRRRTFVEGSPLDRIWGVGLKWSDPRCDDEGNWKGENRLGKCHDEAARIVRESGPGAGQGC